ncbi:MAG TPA: hypothetical protein PKK26_01865 [Candidatus Wallbacteria bacterium]|nr:hypothetical protein [Candidatus Wallbacteria bacterium]
MNGDFSKKLFLVKSNRLFAILIVILLAAVPYFISAYEICEEEFDAYFLGFIAVFSFSFLMLFISFDLINEKNFDGKMTPDPVRLKPVLRGPPYL